MPKIPMTETNKNDKKYDLEERTFQFAKKVALFCKDLSKSLSNIEYARQVIRASGSIGANYIEANEALSKKDFVMCIKVCRKEAKESAYWLQLILETNSGDVKTTGLLLRQEADEFKKIFSAILSKSQ